MTVYKERISNSGSIRSNEITSKSAASTTLKAATSVTATITSPLTASITVVELKTVASSTAVTLLTTLTAA